MTNLQKDALEPKRQEVCTLIADALLLVPHGDGGAEVRCCSTMSNLRIIYTTHSLLSTPRSSWYDKFAGRRLRTQKAAGL
jgi:hypothetical protein